MVVVGRNVEDPKPQLWLVQVVLYTLLAPLKMVAVSIGFIIDEGWVVFVGIVGIIGLLWLNSAHPEIAGLILLAGAAGLVFLCIKLGVGSANEKRDDRIRPIANKLQAEEDERRHRRGQMKHTGYRIEENARQAVDSFKRMPSHLERAQKHRELAGKCYKDEAYSPFWSAIEKTYQALNEYRMEAEYIHERADEHRRLVTEYVRLGGKDHSLADFPVALDAKRVLKNLRTASDDLETIVYEAQKHGTFATIWEQRRTTDTLIKGFVSLEAAVERMGSRMVDAVSKMADDSQLARRETQQALSNVSKTIERTSSQQASQVKDTMNELNRSAGQIRDELYRQRWEGRSLLKG